jgi:hypothetical protein
MTLPTPRETAAFLDGALYGALITAAAALALWLWFGG